VLFKCRDILQCYDREGTLKYSYDVKCKADVEGIGMARGRATHSPHERPHQDQEQEIIKVYHASSSTYSRACLTFLEDWRWSCARPRPRSPSLDTFCGEQKLACCSYKRHASQHRYAVPSYTSWVMNTWTTVTLHLNVFMHQRSEPCGVVGAFYADHSYSQRGKRLPKGRTG